MRFLWTVLLALCVFIAPLNGRADEVEKQQEIVLPCLQPSGFEANDKIVFTYYPPRGVSGGKAPAVIFLHQLMLFNISGDASVYMREGARYMAERGIAAAVMTLPYHGPRAVQGMSPMNRFISGDANAIEQAFGQSVADVRAVTDWLIARPEVDSEKVSGFGASLGAIVLHLAMGKDDRLKSGVALLGGGDFKMLQKQSFLVRFILKNSVKKLSAEQIETLRRVDPVTYAKNNQPRQVLMVQAARDMFVSPQSGEALWQALGKPPIRWIDTNHIALILSTKSAMRASLVFLQATWNGASAQEAAAQTPRITVPTFKFGWLTGLDSRLTPAVQYQALTLGQRNHMSLFSANLGFSGRGPFVSVAATATQFIDVGFAHRINGGKGLKPYASFHVMF